MSDERSNQHKPYFAFSSDVIRSRGILLDTLHALDAHRESLTVVGAHAVYERTKQLTNEREMDATRDADISIFPELLAEAPLLAELMDAIDLEPVSPDRPGVWGLKSEAGRDLHERLTVDLIVPDAIAKGSGRRSADAGVHGKKIASRTKGTELTWIDRDIVPLDSFGQGKPIEGYVAGHAALIAAKAWKLMDRLDPKELERNAQRLRPKDAGDLWRLLATSNPVEVKAIFEKGKVTSPIAAAVDEAQHHVETLLNPGSAFENLTLAHFGTRFSEETIRETIRDWAAGFFG